MNLRVEFDAAELRPLIKQVVAETLDSLEADRVKTEGRLAYTESESAAAIGVQSHVLRDARLRGELSGALVGKRIVYTRDELLQFLHRQSK